MALSFKTGGVWTTVIRPYIKRSGTWTPAQEVWRKVGGVWTRVYLWDVTPPPPPQLSLDLVPTSGGRYINIGVSTPGADNPDVKMTRVLASKTDYPATQFGGNYYSTPDKDYPSEPWSDWYYGTGKEHPSTAPWNYKQYPVNYTSTSNLSAGRYYFQAWSLDFNGNWSAGTYLSINVPTAGLGSNLLSRDGRFQANYSGSYVGGTGFVMGDMKQTTNPVASQGMLFYGTKFIDSIGSYYGNASATITSAQIYLKREDTDGPATSNIYIFQHPYSTPSEVPSVGGPTHTNTVLLGTLSKGEGKWFSLPSSYYAALINGSMRGLGFFYRNPAKAAAQASDYSILNGLTEDWRRSGELFIVWTETP